MATRNDPPDNDDLARWLSRVALGDRQAFEQLYRATSGTLMSIAWRVLQHRDLAEEALQDAFVKVWHSAGLYDARLGLPMTWLINIVRHRAIDLRRSRSAGRVSVRGEDDSERMAAMAAPGAGPEQWLDTAIQRIGVQECMGQLTPAQRQALALVYYQGLTHVEVAQALEAPLGTAKAWVRRGLDYLRTCLQRRGMAAS
ncbi:MAG: sigma-70 family RNA polymerase sigma factor [Burkholderiales bacterium]|nr:sigma-70 family RNA polymerase sigma factor [Burkholderiales bacterium]